MEPKMGQLFKEEVDAYRLYNLYARFNGFGIRRSRNRKLKTSGVKTMQEYCCIREVCILKSHPPGAFQYCMMICHPF
ncbi:unnamed protein product [Urochloa humidicola]